MKTRQDRFNSNVQSYYKVQKYMIAQGVIRRKSQSSQTDRTVGKWVESKGKSERLIKL